MPTTATPTPTWQRTNVTTVDKERKEEGEREADYASDMTVIENRQAGSRQALPIVTVTQNR